MKKLYLIGLMIIGGIFFTSQIIFAQSNEPRVQAVLFYSPTCPHCHVVINELLIPMNKEYGEKLQVVGIDITTPDGQKLYDTAVAHYQITADRIGVPTLIIGKTVLVGSGEIPEQFPSLVKNYLAGRGIGWPDIPGLSELIAAQAPPTPTATPAPLTPAPTFTAVAITMPTRTPTTTIIKQETPPSAPIIGQNDLPLTEEETPPADPLGLGLGTIILLGISGAWLYATWQMMRHYTRLFHYVAIDPMGLIPILSVVGLVVAGYLAYVEISHVKAVCGPIGACNVVQASPYAKIFGMPVAILGMVNYIAIIILWGGQKFLKPPLAHLAMLGLIILTYSGTIFSIYLTLLELVVIQAVCAWCMSSAVISAMLMLWVIISATKNKPDRP